MQTRRRFVSKSLLASLKVMAVTQGLLPLLSSQAKAELFGKVPDDMPTDRSIYRMTGDVTVNGEPANINTFIDANALIKTGNNSEIIFVVGDDAHILRENSELQLSGEGVIESGLKVITGGLLSVFGKRKKAESISLSTSTATIGIRGTGVYLESESDRSYVCTCYGVADIAAQFGDEAETVETEYHDEPRYIYRSNGKDLIQKAPLINHTDAELALVEALVGRVPPFPNFRDNYGGSRRTY